MRSEKEKDSSLCRVLLVDDEPFVRKGLSVLINWEEEGYRIVGEADTGTDALEWIRDDLVDLVISDIKMPGMDGMELIENARGLGNDRVRFLFASGFYEFAYAKNIIRYKGSDYILKPIQKEELTGGLRRIRAELTAQPLSQNKGKGVMGQIEQDIENHFAENISLKALGEKYYFNSAYLGQAFKKQYNQSFKDYVNSVRMRNAAEMLLNTDKKVYEIAEEVGYKNKDYFISKFEEAYRCTPSRFRNRNREI